MLEFLLKLTHKKSCKKEQCPCIQKQESTPAENTIQIPEKIVAEIDYEKLADAIVEANEKIEEKKKEKEQEEYNQQKANWQMALLGRKLNKEEKPSILKTFFGITKIKKENITNTNTTYALLKMCNDLFLCIYKWLFYILSTVSFIWFILNTIINFCSKNYIYGTINAIAFIIAPSALFFIGQIIRVARLEAEICDKKDMVEKTFNFLTSFTAMIFAIMAVIVAIIAIILNNNCTCI